jgi:hypothetical protein
MSAPAAVAEDVTLDEGVANAWQQTIARVNERKRMLGAFLEEIRLVGVAGGTLVLAMDDLHRSVIDSSEHRPIVHEELARAFGKPIEFRCATGEPVTPATRAAQADSLKPMIDRAMEVFDGEVIDRAGRGGERTT